MAEGEPKTLNTKRECMPTLGEELQVQRTKGELPSPISFPLK